MIIKLNKGDIKYKNLNVDTLALTVKIYSPTVRLLLLF